MESDELIFPTGLVIVDFDDLLIFRADIFKAGIKLIQGKAMLFKEFRDNLIVCPGLCAWTVNGRYRLHMNLANLIFYSIYAIRGFISLDSLVHFWLISMLIPGSEHSSLNPFGIQRVS